MVICEFCQQTVDAQQQFVHLASVVLMHGLQISIEDMINVATNVKIKIDQHIYCLCTNCLYNAEVAYSFKLQCVEVEKKQFAQFDDNIKTSMDTNEIQIEIIDEKHVEIQADDPSVDLKQLIVNEDFKMATHIDEIARNCGEVFIPNECEPSKMQGKRGKSTNTCSVCGKSFPKACQLKYHMNRHDNLRAFKCELCGKAFNNASGVRTHMGKVHTEKVRKERKPPVFKCQFCKFTSTVRFKMAAHMKDSHPELLIYECDTCNKKFESQKKLETHEAIHAPGYYNPCEICGVLKGRKAMYMHLKYEHNGTPSNCEDCGKMYISERALKVHQNHVHAIVPLDFECTTCDKRFRYESQLRQHATIHASTGPYKCEHCEFETLSRQGHAMHVRRGHPELNIHKCSSCEFSTPKPEDLATHTETVHNSDKVLTCSECDFTSPTKRLMGIHFRSKHTEAREFKCERCGKTYASKGNLKMHYTFAHSGNPKFKCHLCSMTFSHSTLLRNHIYRHTNVRPYKCALCPRGFLSNANRNQHQATHGEATIKCPLCLELFKTAAALYTHTRRVHRNIRQGKRKRNEDALEEGEENQEKFEFIHIEVEEIDH